MDMDKIDELIDDIKRRVKIDDDIKAVIAIKARMEVLIDRIILLTMQAMVEKMQKNKNRKAEKERS